MLENYKWYKNNNNKKKIMEWNYPFFFLSLTGKFRLLEWVPSQFVAKILKMKVKYQQPSLFLPWEDSNSIMCMWTNFLRHTLLWLENRGWTSRFLFESKKKKTIIFPKDQLLWWRSSGLSLSIYMCIMVLCMHLACRGGDLSAIHSFSLPFSHLQ